MKFSFARQRAACVALLTLVLAAVAPPARATIRYDVSLASPAQHTFHVTMTIPKVTNTVTVQIPAWNGLYQIRDFGFHVTGLHALDDAGQSHRSTRLDKDTWRIEAGSATTIRVIYDSYWDEPGPFGSQLNGEHAFLNLGMLLCYVPNRRAEDTAVHYADLPQNWRIAVELSASSGAAATYTAPNYEALIDAPTEIGSFEELDFRAADRPIRVILHAGPEESRMDRGALQRMLTQIVDYEAPLMGGAPFQEYMFLYHVGRDYGGGGMEHMNCTAISMPSPDQLANVSAHEFFHAWNVKRIRPQSLEPVDYTREMFSPSLWFAEGVTNTYAAFTLVRTGLWSKAQFLGDLSDQITELQTRPAHRWESAEESSLNAWLEKYTLYNTADFSISYYNKGQLLGLLLDIDIRDATNNRASMDDVMRRMNTEYAQQGRFYPDEKGISGVIEEVLSDASAGKVGGAALNLGDFFDRYVSGTDELPFDDFLGRAGLALKTQELRRPNGAVARVYVVAEMPNPNEKQARILNGLLRGTTDGSPAAQTAGRAPAK